MISLSLSSSLFEHRPSNVLVSRTPCLPLNHRPLHKPQLLLMMSSHTTRRQHAALRAARRSTQHATAVDSREITCWEPPQLLLNAELLPPPLPSAYDTAWVAMVPSASLVSSSSSPPAPRFPQCVDWILRNQRGDGSWGAGVGGEPSLRRDTLSSTMACVLALATWGVGDVHVAEGLRFIGENSACATTSGGGKPVGFDVIFPGMLARGIDMGLEIPLPQPEIDAILRLRDTELNSMASGCTPVMAYVAEGLGNLIDWGQVMAYQRKNGSFFNSPATTAAVAIHSCNDRALDYLDSVVSKFGSSVPTVYPWNAYSRLRKVDTMENMGISGSFSYEINSILDMTQKSWLANDEEIMLDMTTCAMAFRLLRMHGYDVSSDVLEQFCKESCFDDSAHGNLYDTEALLELYKASQVQIFEEELILENIGSWTSKLLKKQLCSHNISGSVDPAEVEHVLKFPFYATLDRLEHRWNIENFKSEGFQMIKSVYSSGHTDEEIAMYAANEFHSAQALYQEELQYLKSTWVKEMRLEELDFARILPMNTYFPPASTIFPPELADARITCCQNSMLATAIDDLFDVGGSREEMQNLVKLIEMWDAYEEVGFYSERVEIIFRAVYNTSNKIAAKAEAVQNRSVIKHIAELWGDLVRAMMAEAEWSMTGRMPTIEEYMAAAEPSFALGPVVLMPLYLVGPALSEEVVRSQEYINLFHHMNVCGRFLNDLKTYKREKAQGKINSVLLLANSRHGGDIKAAKREASGAIEASRKELLRLVVGGDGGGDVVPPRCRLEFWNMCKVLHVFYMEGDSYSVPELLVHAANAVVLDPLRLPEGRSIPQSRQVVNIHS
ncbi:unnamed protein product [Urochloa humidicola]